MSAEKTISIKKFRITIVIFAVALLVAVGGIFGIYAAMQQTVTTSFSIGYSVGKQVAVAVNARIVPVINGSSDYENATWFTGKDKNNNTLTPAANNLFAINASESEDKGVNLSVPKNTFGSPMPHLCFYFENLSNEKSIMVTVTNSIVPNNLTVNAFGGVVPSTEVIDSESTMPLSTNQLPIPPGMIYCYFLVFVPINENVSGSFETTDTTGISFSIQQAG